MRALAFSNLNNVQRRLPKEFERLRAWQWNLKSQQWKGTAIIKSYYFKSCTHLICLQEPASNFQAINPRTGQIIAR
jgi:hypothetical protein